MGGDVISTETFEVNEESDVIFVIIEEGTDFRCWFVNMTSKQFNCFNKNTIYSESRGTQ